MATWQWTEEALSAGMQMTSDTVLPPLSFLQAHPEVDPLNPPATLPSDTETITLFEPDEAARMATDWRMA